MTTTETATATATIIPKPPRYHNSTWQLLSQGAEARIWLIPNYIQIQTSSTSTCANNGASTPTPLTSYAICKERFAKSYRHPVLNDTLTRARAKAEARSLTRCRRGGVSVPVVLGVDMPNKLPNGDANTNTNGKDDASGAETSACLFLEYINGCAVRSFLNMTNDKESSSDSTLDSMPKSKSESTSKEVEPPTKKMRLEDDETKCLKNDNVAMDVEKEEMEEENKPKVRMDEYSKQVATAIGTAIGKMHNIGIIHGDLTTSNILLRNPLPPPTESSSSLSQNNNEKLWEPDIAIIDFGLSSTSVNTSSSKKKKSVSASCHEERAVDLYVLERAFITTHAGSKPLVDEILRAYKRTCTSSDSVFQRLSQVRLRGRKRECFG